MRHLGIELGRSRCVLVPVEDHRAADGLLHASAPHVLKYENPATLATDRCRLRLEHRPPRRARVVTKILAGAAAAVILLVLLFWPARQASNPATGTSATSGGAKSRRAALPPNLRSA